MNKLPEKLVKLRKHYNYSQSYLAEILRIKVIEYMNFENGAAVPSYNQCKRLASFYHIDIIEIISNERDVTLYDISNANTDELNIEFFAPKKNLINKTIDLIKSHKLASLALILFLISVIVLTTIIQKNSININLETTNLNRLSISETTVIYIDETGAVKGSGDNANSQLSNLPGKNAVKAVEGSTFTAVLFNNGTISVSSRLSIYHEAEEWKNIVDIAAGDNHLVALNNKGEMYAVGDNTYLQCEVSKFDNIKKIFASKKATIAVDKNGKIVYSGEFIGSSKIKSFTNIIDLDVSDNILVILTEDNKVEYFTKNSETYKVGVYSNIVDVSCGDNFIALLDENGKVHLEINNSIAAQNEVDSWSNIIAIDAASNYLIGFDGKEIKGVGKNTYNQFVKDEAEKPILSQVKNININYDESNLFVTFDTVLNATAYLVSLNDEGFPQSVRITSNKARFDVSNLVDGKVYEVSIIAIGDENYDDSQTVIKTFDYIKIEKVIVIEDLLNKSIEDLQAYLETLGLKSINGVELDEICGTLVPAVTKVEGLSSFQEITENQLKETEVTYKYCKVLEDE